jgi:2-iminobutanoate/2-iminopropanoate deaminase
VRARAIRTNRAPAPAGSYSQAIVVGEIVYVSGQGPFDPGTGRIVGETVRGQTAQALDNIAAILDAAGCGLRDVVRVSAHLAGFDLFEEYDAVYAAYFSRDPRPARTTVASELGGILVEIDATAVLPVGHKSDLESWATTAR